MTSIRVAFALALLMRVSTLEAEPASANQSVPRDMMPTESQQRTPVLVQAWCGEAIPSGADAAPEGLPGNWAAPAVRSNDKPLVRQPNRVSPDAVAEPQAVSIDANPPTHIDRLCSRVYASARVASAC